MCDSSKEGHGCLKEHYISNHYCRSGFAKYSQVDLTCGIQPQFINLTKLITYYKALLLTLVKGSRVLPLMLLCTFEFILNEMCNDSHTKSSLPDPAFYFFPLLSLQRLLLIPCIHHILKPLCTIAEGTICLFPQFFSVFDLFFFLNLQSGRFCFAS